MSFLRLLQETTSVSQIFTNRFIIPTEPNCVLCEIETKNLYSFKMSASLLTLLMHYITLTTHRSTHILRLAAQTSEKALDLCSECTWFESRLEDLSLWLRVLWFPWGKLRTSTSIRLRWPLPNPMYFNIQQSSYHQWFLRRGTDRCVMLLGRMVLISDFCKCLGSSYYYTSVHSFFTTYNILHMGVKKYFFHIKMK
jgi:hypothetical protein